MVETNFTSVRGLLVWYFSFWLYLLFKGLFIVWFPNLSPSLGFIIQFDFTSRRAYPRRLAHVWIKTTQLSKLDSKYPNCHTAPLQTWANLLNAFLRSNIFKQLNLDFFKFSWLFVYNSSCNFKINSSSKHELLNIKQLL